MTLFELLVGVTVIFLLVIFFLISLPQMLITTKISRVKEEHTVLVRALTHYHMDYGSFPSSARGLRSLSAPTAYLASIPIDPFSKEGKQSQYFYISNISSDISYVIISLGPDGDNDLLNIVSKFPEYLTSTHTTPQERTMNLREIVNLYVLTKSYDPTNGIMSDGDLIFVGK